MAEISPSIVASLHKISFCNLIASQMCVQNSLPSFGEFRAAFRGWYQRPQGAVGSTFQVSVHLQYEIEANNEEPAVETWNRNKATTPEALFQ
jgi:hypothetical protein